MSQKRKRPEESAADTSLVFRSEQIEDRSSTFVGLFSPSLKPKELQALSEIKDASHKILAWRRVSNQQAITGDTKFVSGHDDDGEKYAGKRVEKVLEEMNVEGSCVVARWYGGVLLGPVRFTHIEQCARQAIEKWRESKLEEVTKKQKVEEDANEKPKLIKTLIRRDESIAVLRKLAMEKEDEVKNAKLSAEHADTKRAARDEATSSAQTKPTIDYESTSVEKLRTLEKARDATLSFLLKRIDKAEEELGQSKPAEEDTEPP